MKITAVVTIVSVLNPEYNRLWDFCIEILCFIGRKHFSFIKITTTREHHVKTTEVIKTLKRFASFFLCLNNIFIHPSTCVGSKRFSQF